MRLAGDATWVAAGLIGDLGCVAVVVVVVFAAARGFGGRFFLVGVLVGEGVVLVGVLGLLSRFFHPRNFLAGALGENIDVGLEAPPGFVLVGMSGCEGPGMEAGVCPGRCSTTTSDMGVPSLPHRMV